MLATRDRAEAELVAQPSSGDIEILDGIDDVIDADDSSSPIPDDSAARFGDDRGQHPRAS